MDKMKSKKRKNEKSFNGFGDSKINSSKIDVEAELDRDYERLSKP